MKEKKIRILENRPKKVQKIENLSAKQAQIYLSFLTDGKEKWASDIRPFDGIEKKDKEDKIRFKFEKENDVWYLRIH